MNLNLQEAFSSPITPTNHEDRLPEFELYRPRPGHPDWPRLQGEARELADKLRPGLAKPRGRGADLKRRLAAALTYVQGHRTNRRLQKAGREDFRPFILHWTALRSCNFKCVYCDDHQGRKYPDLSDEGVLGTEDAETLLRIMRTRTPAVYFAGGEPTIREDLPRLTRTARDLDYYPIMISTNASLLHRKLAKPQWRTWLADTDTIIVSLDGFDLGQLRTMWSYRQPENVIRNLLLLRELAGDMHFKLMINTVIQPGALEAASDVLDFANDLDIWFTPVPVNVGPRVDPAIRNDPAYLRLANKIIECKRAGHRIVGSARLNRRLLYSAPLDCRTTLKPHVDYDGSLYWPCKATVNVAPKRINVLDFENVDALYEHARRLVEPTRFHGPAENQCGADCNWAQYYATDAYAHGLAHPTQMLRDVLEFAFER